MATPAPASSATTSDEEEEDETASDDHSTVGTSEDESDEDAEETSSEESGDDATAAPGQTGESALTARSSLEEEDSGSSGTPDAVSPLVPVPEDSATEEEGSLSASLSASGTLEEEGDLESAPRKKTPHLVEITLAMPWGSETIAAYAAQWNEAMREDAFFFRELFFNPYDPPGAEPFEKGAADKVAVVERGQISIAAKGNNAAEGHCVGVMVVDHGNIGDEMPFETRELLKGECVVPVFLIGADDGEKVISCLLDSQVVVENIHDCGPVSYYGEHPTARKVGKQTKLVWKLEFSTRTKQKRLVRCEPSSWTSIENLFRVRGRCFFDVNDRSAMEVAPRRRFGMVRFCFRGPNTFQDKLEKSQVCAALVVINNDKQLQELKIDTIDPRMIPAFLISQTDGHHLIRRFDQSGEGLSLNQIIRVFEEESTGTPDDLDIISVVEEAVVQAVTLQVLIGPYERRFPCLTTDWTTYTDLIPCEGTIIFDIENPFGTVRKNYPEDTILVVRRGEVSYHEKAINAQEGGCRCLLISAENMPTFFVISSVEGAKADIPTVLIRDSARRLLQHTIQRGERARLVGWICGHQQGGEGVSLQFKDDVDQSESDPTVYAITCSGNSAADWEMLHAYKLSSEMAEDKILCISEAEFIGALPDAIRSGVVAILVMQPSEPYMFEVPAHQCDILIASCNEIQIFNMLDDNETVTKVEPCAPESDLWVQLVFNAPPWHVKAVLGDWVMDLRALHVDTPVVFLKKNPTGESPPFLPAEVEGAYVLVEESNRAFFRLAAELKHAGALGFIMGFTGHRIPLMVSPDANVLLPGLAISVSDMRALRAGRGSSDTIVRGPLGTLHLIAYDMKDMVYLPEPVTRDLKEENFEVWLTLAPAHLGHFHVKGIMSIMTTFTQCTHDLMHGILSPTHAQDRISLQHAVPFGNRTVLQDAQLQGIRGLLAINMKNAPPHCLGHHESAHFPTVSISHEDGMHIVDLLGKDVEIRVIDVTQTKKHSDNTYTGGVSGGVDTRPKYEARIDEKVEARNASRWNTLQKQRRDILREMMRVHHREHNDPSDDMLTPDIDAKQFSDEALALVDTFTATPGCDECPIISAQLHAIIQSLLGCSRIVVEGQWNGVELCGALKTYLLPLVDLDSRIPALLRRCEADFENFPVGKDTVFLQFDRKALRSLTHDYFTQESAPLRFSTRAAPKVVSGKGKVMVCAELVYDCPPFGGGPSIGMQLLLPTPMMDLYIEGSLIDSQGADRSAICKTSAFGAQGIMTLEPGAKWQKCRLCDHRNDAFVDWLREGNSNLLLVVEWYRG